MEEEIKCPNCGATGSEANGQITWECCSFKNEDNTPFHSELCYGRREIQTQIHAELTAAIQENYAWAEESICDDQAVATLQTLRPFVMLAKKYKPAEPEKGEG